MASEFAATFLKDAFGLLDSLNHISMSTQENGAGPEIARALHSLKSGASFLGWEELETAAHGLEEDLVRDSGRSTDWFEAVNRLQQILHFRSQELSERNRKPETVGRAVKFSDLDRRILVESRRRNEFFYRLTCRIDPSEPLPYPRAYLLASRLETGTTLVKTDPPMNNPDGNFSRPTFWFTTDVTESEIFTTANVDLVEVVELLRLNYQDVLNQEEVILGDIVPVAEDDTTLVVDRSRYSDIMQLTEELAWRLEDRPGTPESTLAGELQRTLETLAFRPLEPLLSDLGSAVARLAERRGVKARFEWTVASVGLDAVTLESLGEILKQLIRNSIKHGIEPVDERVNSGKSEFGVLSLRQERTGQDYSFIFEDDGRGIDEEAVFEKAKRQGLIPEGEIPSLLNILCHPGFSTAAETDIDGGRGIGLEMVGHMLSSEFGSELELENSPGRGLAVRWTLPEKHQRRPYLVFLADGRKWAIPADSVKRRGVMEPSRINASGQGYSLGGGLIPMVGPLGLRPPGTVMPYFLEIHHRGRRAALLVDDLVAEEPWGSDDLVAADPAGPWCRSLRDSKDGIPVLSPALVYAAE